MTFDTLFPMLMFLGALLAVSLIIFFIKKTLVSRAKIKTLSAAREKAEEYIEKNALEMAPILTSFYGEKTEHYLKTIKKQNQVVCNQLLSLMMEYKPNIVTTLTGSLETVHETYMNVFYEASQAHHALTNNLQQASPLPVEYLSQEIKQTILVIAQICQQEVDEQVFEDIHALPKLMLDFKEKIEAIFQEHKVVAEDASQYLDLIEQLRVEKKDMRQTINQALNLLEQIYQTYQAELKLPENITFKQFNYDALLAAFKVSAPVKSE